MPSFARYIYLAARVRPEPSPTQCCETGSKGITTEQKLAHVERWKKSGGTKRDFAKAIGVTEFTFREWTKGKALGQHGMTNVTAPEIREKALKLYRAGSTGGKIAKEMGIPEGTVRGWVTAWRQEGAI